MMLQAVVFGILLIEIVGDDQDMLAVDKHSFLDTPKTRCRTENYNGYLRNVCRNTDSTDVADMVFKCWTSDSYYSLHNKSNFLQVFYYNHVCETDTRFYQVCGHIRASAYNNHQDDLCGYYICNRTTGNTQYNIKGVSVHQGFDCNNKTNCFEGNDKSQCEYEKEAPYTCQNGKDDGGIDDDCITLGYNCTIHKHRVYDGTDDCGNGVDEAIRKTTENITCVRRVNFSQPPKKQKIPYNWLCDGTKDCVSGIDEDTDHWEVCHNDTPFAVTCVESKKECRELFKCSDTKAIKLSNLCGSSRPVCDKEAHVCGGNRHIRKTPFEQNNTKLMSHCLPGIQWPYVPGSTDKMCIQESHHFFEDAYGTIPTPLFHPAHNVSCRYLYGEIYVYMSCLDLCEDAACPLKRLEYSSCMNRGSPIFTLTKNNTLTVVKKLHGQKYNNELFSCDNKRCINFDKVCDLMNDCGDHSDEDNCSNHFKCEDHKKHTVTYIPLSSKCDGKFDCANGADECNPECDRSIINKVYLKVIAWVIGILATLCNLVIAVINIWSIPKKVNNRTVLTITVFIILIAIGDMLVGLYLIVLATYDHIKGNTYCKEQFDWLTSSTCSNLGIMNSIGTQISLFSMVGLSLYRVHAMKRMTIKRTAVTRKFIAYLSIILTIFVVTPSLIISIGPVLKKYENYFGNGLCYLENPILKGAVHKNTHAELLQGYHGRMLMKPTPMSWDKISKLVQEMFTENYGGIKGKQVSFYGNDAVCLFKYFVTPNDSQQGYSIAILVLNFLCFLVITISYGFVNYINMRSANRVASPASRKTSQNLQTRISIIILTDFLCWIPFIFTCLLHYCQVMDATPYYSCFSILVLPLNSLINPLIYDRTFSDLITKYIKCPAINKAPKQNKAKPSNTSGKRKLGTIRNIAMVNFSLKRHSIDVGNETGHSEV